ncbi:MAG: rhomboid family intramembrane serine protease [Bacteroidota bacterium]
MEPFEFVTYGLILLNIGISAKGFSDKPFFHKYMLQVDGVLGRKEYIRLFSSGFLHVNWFHLILNMYVLYMFSESVLNVLSLSDFVLLYMGSLLGGNLLAVYLKRNDGTYSAVGASGAVSGLLFASIIFFPKGTLSLVFIPVQFPAWAFGIGYLLLTMYGIRAQRDNIGHEAHFGGAIAGVLMAVMMKPQIIGTNGWVVGVILVPAVLFLYVLTQYPELLRTGKKSPKVFVGVKEPAGVDDRLLNQLKSRPATLSKEEELNQLLDKVRQKGFQNLSKSERARLEQLSQELDG